MKSNTPLSRKENIVVQEADGEILIYDLSKNKAFCLNETSALVWEMCDGKTSVSEISQGLAKKLNAPANEDLVWLAIDQLKKEKLISNFEEVESKFEGMSRREVIKKVGMGTMIALPVIIGLATPTAAQAGSVCNGTVMCNCNSSSGTVGNICMTDGGNGNNVPVPCANGCACQRVTDSGNPATVTTNSGICVAPTP